MRMHACIATIKSVKHRREHGENMRLDSATVTINCPKCETPKRLALKQLLSQETVRCMGCGVTFTFKDKEGEAKKKLEKTQQSIDELERDLRRLGVDFHWDVVEK